MLVPLPSVVETRISSLTVGISRPDEIVLDTPAGPAFLRRLRGSPRWAGTMEIGLTADPDEAAVIEAFLSQISKGRPNRWTIPRDSERTIAAQVAATRDADGEWTLGAAAPAGLAVGAWVGILGRGFQIVSGAGTKWRLEPDLPFTNASWTPFAGLVVYLSDASPVFMRRQPVGRRGYAIWGPWSIPFTEWTG